jgi:monofunctional biosynthetic peptidoglycan transglycosylase
VTRRSGGRSAGGARAVRRPRRRWLRWVFRGLLFLVVAFVAFQLWFFAQVAWWAWFNPSDSAFMRAERERLAQTRPGLAMRHTWVPYERISVHLKRAVIAAEDANFTEHDGIDWDAIEKAREANRRKGKVVRGGSTITMQLAKNLFLSGERSYVRKGQELIITTMIEAVMSKRRILELYLNLAEWGEGVFGCEAGARHYYGVPAAQVGPAQAARMAAMLPRPRYYDRNRSTPYLERRSATIQRWAADITPP